ncbi:Uncharacterised protein [Escherichia coli]|nr:Uncharacterised protein [Escherichia coli]
MGEFGGMSHDEDYSSAPNSIKKCAKKYGFEPEPSKDLSCKTSGLSTTDAALATGATIGAGYVIYRVIRFYTFTCTTSLVVNTCKRCYSHD